MDDRLAYEFVPTSIGELATVKCCLCKADFNFNNTIGFLEDWIDDKDEVGEAEVPVPVELRDDMTEKVESMTKVYRKQNIELKLINWGNKMCKVTICQNLKIAKAYEDCKQFMSSEEEKLKYEIYIKTLD